MKALHKKTTQDYESFRNDPAAALLKQNYVASLDKLITEEEKMSELQQHTFDGRNECNDD